jgi:hypothetical protein
MNAPIRLYMTMSLDGFIAGPDDQPGQELGRDGFRLFNGRRLFDGLGPEHIELGLVRRLAARDVTHLRYRVRV